ncbi:MAG: hypothetical protein JXA10_20260 [Anaerolineae bacterium]|nr:hypothetical protein [Anaerolineae bacterium]
MIAKWVATLNKRWTNVYHYWRDPVYRQRTREIQSDLKLTHKTVDSWGQQGLEQVDPNRRFGIISFTNFPLHAKFQGALGKLMQLHGYHPVIFTNRSATFAHEYFQMFGITDLVMWNDFAKAHFPTTPAIDQQIDDLLATRLTVPDLVDYQFHGVDVGKHALSVVSRRLVEGRLDLQDHATQSLLREYLHRAMVGVVTAERFMDDNPLDTLLVRDSGYIPNGAIFEVALQRGVDCVVYEQGLRRGTWVLKRYTPESKGLHYFSISPETWATIKDQPWTEADDQLLEREFAGRYKPDSTDDTRRLQAGKQVKSPEVVRQQLGLDPGKKTAVIFSHLAWDATFFFGTCLFDDFEDWLFETVKFVAANCPQMNWIVKLHPFNVFKLQREDKTEESEMRLLRQLEPLPDNVKIMRADTDINTSSLFQVVDYVLTVNGTVGMEFPCYGVPALLAGTGRYDHRGFTLDSASKEEYFVQLTTLHTVPKLDEPTQQLARQHFAALMLCRQYSLDDALPMQLKRVHEAQSNVHDNIEIAATSLEEFKAFTSLQNLGGWLGESREPDLFDRAGHCQRQTTAQAGEERSP